MSSFVTRFSSFLANCYLFRFTWSSQSAWRWATASGVPFRFRDWLVPRTLSPPKGETDRLGFAIRRGWNEHSCASF